MTAQTNTRKLAAIFYADVAGYSRLMGLDEDGTHHQLCASLDLMADRIRNANGRVVHYAGDAVLASFDSVVAATNCAIAIQRAIDALCADISEDKRLLYRIGINLGEVIVDRNDIFGDGVNVAARLEGLAEPGGICVSATVREHLGDKIGCFFEDMGAQTLKNIDRPIRAYRIAMNPGTASTSSSPREIMIQLNTHSNLIAPATKAEEADLGSLFEAKPPSIMILPFRNLSGDPSKEDLVDGFRLSIQSTLVKLSGLFLINAPAVEIYRHREISASQAGNEVGVRYVLEGAVQIAGERLRVTVQLTDAPASNVVWAERFDRVIDDIFDIQDEITTEVALALDANLAAGKQALMWWKATPNRASREIVLRGLSHLYKGNKHDNAFARDLFRDLEQFLPNEPQGLALRSFTHWLDAFQGWSEDRKWSLDRATELAEKAIALGDPDGFGHIVLGHVRLFERRHDEAISLCAESSARRLSCPLALGIYADVLRYCGESDNAIKEIKKAVRLDRISPSWMANVLAHAYRDSGEITPSILIAKQSLRLDPENLDGHAILCADYILSKSVEAAHMAGQNILRIDPSFSIRSYLEKQPYKNNKAPEYIASALSEAGLPK